jgi:hypothetical protein
MDGEPDVPEEGGVRGIERNHFALAVYLGVGADHAADAVDRAARLGVQRRDDMKDTQSRTFF